MIDMLTKATTSARQVSQAPLKDGTCHLGCGAKIQYRTNSRVICETCKPAHRAEQIRLAACRQRRKKGVPAVGDPGAICCGCQANFTRLSSKSRRCPPCQASFLAESARAKSVAKYATKDGREYAHAYRRQRRETDPAFALNLRIKTYMAKSLRGGKQGRKWQSLVGYDLPTLMRHLERQFLPGMTWENRSEWHVDHVVPLAAHTFASADDPEFRAAWALSNLRPLWKADNLAKSDQRLFLL